MGSVLWADGHVKAMRPAFRVRGVSADSDARRNQNIGMLSPIGEIPGDIVADDPRARQLDYYFLPVKP